MKQYRSLDDLDHTYDDQYDASNAKDDNDFKNAAKNDALLSPNLVKDQDAMSEYAHYGTQVKRSNMVEFFVNELAADRYISTHLYGAIDRID